MTLGNAVCRFENNGPQMEGVGEPGFGLEQNKEFQRDLAAGPTEDTVVGFGAGPGPVNAEQSEPNVCD